MYLKRAFTFRMATESCGLDLTSISTRSMSPSSWSRMGEGEGEGEGEVTYLPYSDRVLRVGLVLDLDSFHESLQLVPDG